MEENKKRKTENTRLRVIRYRKRQSEITLNTLEKRKCVVLNFDMNKSNQSYNKNINVIHQYQDEENESVNVNNAHNNLNANNLITQHHHADHQSNDNLAAVPHFDTENSGDDCEINLLRKWAISSNISHDKLSDLLCILRRRVLPCLPKNAKTFLKTQLKPFNIQKIDDTSEFIYFGVACNLQRIIKVSNHTTKNIELLFNVDGIPLFKSSSIQFWPILCKIFNTNSGYKPFVVALYSGVKKPSNIFMYFNDFIEEINKLQENGLEVHGEHFKISIKPFICDRPARSLMKSVKNHGGYYACERCIIRGKRVQNRTVYTKVNCVLRTEESFRNQTNQEHHTGLSPLLG